MKTVSDAIHLILISFLAAAVTITVGYYSTTMAESLGFVVPIDLWVTSNTNVMSSLYVTTPGDCLNCGL